MGQRIHIPADFLSAAVKLLYEISDLFFCDEEDRVEIDICHTVFTAERRKFFVQEISRFADMGDAGGESESGIGVPSERKDRKSVV